MTNALKLLAAAAAVGGLAAPAAAQYAQPYYPQPYQQYPQTYPGYGYPQGYSNNPVGAIIDQLLGNRYNVTDRQAVSQCATAVIAQAQSQYGGYGGGYSGYGYNGYNRGYSNLRVTSITDVERRSNGLRVRGTLGTGYGGGYGQYGYQNGYAAGELSFRCNVDYRGAVTNIRINRSDRYRRY